MEAIVVTGMGIVSTLGAGKEVTLRKLLAEESAIAPVRYLATKHKEWLAGEVPFSNDELALQCVQSAPANRTSMIGQIALQEALADAGLADGKTSLRIAFISGNIVGGMDQSERHFRDACQDGRCDNFIDTYDSGACTADIARAYRGRFDFISTPSTACSSSTNALIFGGNILQTGYADIVVAGGTDCLSKFHVNGFNTLKILDAQRCRPFDANRNGINLGEGAAYLVLERAANARRRGAHPIARLSGYGNACDAYHQTAMSPDGDGAYLAMCEALRSAGLTPADIGYINAHGTGTVNNDESEGAAVQRLFGEKVPPISSTKAYTGHTTAAAGAIESVISILALQHHFIPANLGFTQKMERLHFTPVTKVQNGVKLQHVLNNSFGFGGNDSSCIFSTL